MCVSLTEADIYDVGRRNLKDGARPFLNKREFLDRYGHSLPSQIETVHQLAPGHVGVVLIEKGSHSIALIVRNNKELAHAREAVVGCRYYHYSVDRKHLQATLPPDKAERLFL